MQDLIQQKKVFYSVLENKYWEKVNKGTKLMFFQPANGLSGMFEKVFEKSGNTYHYYYEIKFIDNEFKLQLGDEYYKFHFGESEKQLVLIDSNGERSTFLDIS